jgi:hypothetical protein
MTLVLGQVMIQIPANLAQRILDAARIATAIHLEQDAQERAAQAKQLDQNSTEAISE